MTDLVVQPVNQEIITKPLTPMDLMQQLIQRGDVANAVDVAKELVALQSQMWQHELAGRKVDAEVEFNASLAAASAEMKLIINDSDKTGPGGKRWSTYRALNNAAKPIWIKNGLGVSYDSEPSPVPDQMFMVAHVSKGFYTRKYMIPMDISGKGPKGDGALSKPHAIGAGIEYGRRDLIRMIFDLITGEEEILTNGELITAIGLIEKAPNVAELRTVHAKAFSDWADYPAAIKCLQEARNKRHKELIKNGH